jgi:hypothetical protein
MLVRLGAVMAMPFLLMVELMVVTEIVIVTTMYFYVVVFLVRDMNMRMTERRQHDAEAHHEANHADEA